MRAGEIEITLALALRDIAELKEEMHENNSRHEKKHVENAQKIAELEGWKDTCTRWGIWWAGVCAAVMATATFVRTYWSDISKFFKGLP